MKLSNRQEVEATEEKIAILEQEYQRVRQGQTEANPAAQKMILTSLRRTINQMKEDIVRYQSVAAVRG